MGSHQSVEDRASWRLCLGCGACYCYSNAGGYRLFDFSKEGIRSIKCRSGSSCHDDRISVCPLVETDFSLKSCGSGVFQLVGPEWGPVLEIWEGHAANPEIRYRGASGGVLTALSAFAVEEMGMKGVLHTGQDPEDPVRNRTRLSRNLKEILSASGSRYSPASVCNGLHLVENAGGPCAFIGRPVEVAALRNLERTHSDRIRNVAAIFSFICAEAPSTQGTLDLLKQMQVETDRMDAIHYRGNGWPGYFAPHSTKASEPLPRMTYRESWAFLQAYRPWVAQIWPDGSGELADISCGDPWYKEPDGKNPGSSMVVVRTERGRKILHGAMAAGYLELGPAEPWKLEQSQKGLIKKKGAIWGRLMVMRLFGLPTPNYYNAHLFKCWKKLCLEEKLRSILGTARRIIARKIYKPIEFDLKDAVTVKDAMIGCVQKVD